MAEQEAEVAAIGLQGPIAGLTAGVREYPGVIGGGILEFAAEAEVGFGDERLGVGGPAFGAVPGGGLGGLVGGEGEAGGGA